MSSNPGYPPSPLSTPLINSNLVPIKSFGRRPTTQDVKYRPGQFAILDGNPSTGSAGELWYLAYFSAGVPQWVQLAGGGVDLESFIPDTGTSPVGPDASNQITLTGAQVAAGTIGANVIDISGGTNTLTTRIQIAAAAATTDSDNNGVCHFNSAQFSVDANGFVALTGGGAAIDSFIVSSGTSPVVPDGSGQITLTDGNGTGWTGGTNAMTVDMVSPFTGDFTFTGTLGAETAIRVGDDPPVITTGKLTIQFEEDGSDVEAEVRNTSDTADSNAIFGTVVGGSSAGDPYHTFNVGNVLNWAYGIRNSDADAWYLTVELTPPGDLSGTLIQKWTTAGEITMPLQPAFQARLNTDATNVTGAGTTYILGDTDVGAALTEIFDQGGDLTAGSSAGAIFECPVDAKVSFDVLWVGINTTVATTFDTQIVTSNRGYPITNTRAAASTDESEVLSVLADMDAADTAYVTMIVNGEAGDTAAIGKTATVWMGHIEV